MLYMNRMQGDTGEFPMACLIMEGSQPFITHCHQEMELIVVREGCLEVKYEDELLMLEKGDVWLVPPFVSHSIEAGSSDSIRLAILIDLKLMDGWEQQAIQRLDFGNILERTDMYSRHWAPDVVRKVRNLIEAMYKEYTDRTIAWNFAVKTLLNQLFLQMIREMPAGGEKHLSPGAEMMKTILSYISLHYCGEITLKGCADEAGFHPNYLSRYFREQMGITFQEYIKKLRIDRAKWLLQNEKMSITEVLFQSGFRDIKTFNKLFKKECGVTPTEFRKSKDMRSLSKA